MADPTKETPQETTPPKKPTSGSQATKKSWIELAPPWINAIVAAAALVLGFIVKEDIEKIIDPKPILDEATKQQIFDQGRARFITGEIEIEVEGRDGNDVGCGGYKYWVKAPGNRGTALDHCHIINFAEKGFHKGSIPLVTVNILFPSNQPDFSGRLYTSTIGEVDSNKFEVMLIKRDHQPETLKARVRWTAFGPPP